MAYILNAPADFAAEALAGFVAANADTIVAVDGGAAVRAPSPLRRVSLVTGGGSGHYPAFAGFVGDGMADAAVAGNVFASPSDDAIASVARAVSRPGGVLFCFGNYSGDVLQFGAAARSLEAEGIPTATVLVTDDIASAPPERASERRGIAGDLFLLKVLGAAADRGMGIAELEAIGARANAATTTLGVAFSGCTLPGHDKPLFEVTPGSIALGLGIHGEPGLQDAQLTTADDLAATMVDRLLAERPPSGADRVVAIVNGLGSVKSEELFVLYTPIAERLMRAGVTIVSPEIGEFVTSFEMAGVSLTLSWLDEELESLWLAPADAPGYRRGLRDRPDAAHRRSVYVEAPTAIGAASTQSQRAAGAVVNVLAAVAERLDADSAMLGQLDAVAGDGDHGIGMSAGGSAASLKAQELHLRGAGAGTVLCGAGVAWNRSAGGTSGGLWAALLNAIGMAVGDLEYPTADRVAAGVTKGLADIRAIGKADVGDKTLVDALVPFAEKLSSAAEAGQPLPMAWEHAAAAAVRAAESTAELSARVGRARTHGDSSLGTPDPGAVSLGIVATVIANELKKTSTGAQG
ncbi:MAG: D-erythrulose 4-kinase [Mycobacterium sp.]|nr:D-erythrulose 4-kinase [Mycobacterium sp.]